MTQPAFNLEALKNVQEYRAKLPMVVGVMVLRDLQHARRYRAGGRIHSSATNTNPKLIRHKPA